MKYGLDADRVRGEWQRRDEIPFDAAYRFMATLGVAADGEAWIFVKGAPERLMEMSAAQLSSAGTAEPVDPTLWTDAVADAASRGERVLGFAAKRVRSGERRVGEECVGRLRSRWSA